MAEEKVYIGRAIENVTTSEYKDGVWVVIISVLEKRKEEGAEWEERKVEVMSTDVTEEKAFDKASQDLLNMLIENNGNLFENKKPTVHDLEIQDGVLGSTDTIL